MPFISLIERVGELTLGNLYEALNVWGRDFLFEPWCGDLTGGTLLCGDFTVTGTLL